MVYRRMAPDVCAMIAQPALMTDDSRHYTIALQAMLGENLNTILSRASTKHTSGAEQKYTTREVIGQRKCPRQLFGRSVTEAGWQQAG